MPAIPVGLILLIAVVVLTVAGVAHRVFDRLHLTDAQALIFIGLIIAGSFFSLTLYRGAFTVGINVGGGILPIALAIWVLSKAGTGREWSRALLATIITTAVLYGASKLMAGFGHGRYDFLDPVYLFGILAGIVGYVTAARSRRASFVAATLGVVLLDVINVVETVIARYPNKRIMIGGAGAFDTLVIAGVLAVLLAEIIGEASERLVGGPDRDEPRPPGLVLTKTGEPIGQKFHDEKESSEKVSEEGEGHEKS